MTSKSFNVEQKHSITPSMEKSVAKAYEEFAPKQVGPRLYNGTLRRFPNRGACRHSWKVAALSREHAEYIKSVTEEAPEPGSTKWCANCGAVSYWEGEELWLYDATTKFFGKPPKRKHT